MLLEYLEEHKKLTCNDFGQRSIFFFPPFFSIDQFLRSHSKDPKGKNQDFQSECSDRNFVRNLVFEELDLVTNELMVSFLNN